MNRLLQEIPSDLLTEWMAFARLEPFGFESEMYGHGIVSSVLVNLQKKKGSKGVKPEDFIPTFVETPERTGTFFQDLKQAMISRTLKHDSDQRTSRKTKPR